ncbi:unnamed protein product [Ambrosiozyma monospora]|uniref:Unnamed protein product n=1 Tax=Ambrosiozyma monospora TaxID=43982 RepID=A0A9W6YSH5_AMBMO|nr:unnamed protein product [Ambrosiozyma monospora]
MTISTGTIVGALACQKDSYLKQLITRVVSCTESKPVLVASTSSSGKKSKKKSKQQQSSPSEPVKPVYEVEFEDTVLFPEGGGQPSDSGTITLVNEEGKTVTDPTTIQVNSIQRVGLRAIHMCPEPLPVGQKVLLKVDWKKRFDFMQQHTGQHLLSAILDRFDEFDQELVNPIEIKPRNGSKEKVLPTLGWHMGVDTDINYIEIPKRLTQPQLDLLSSTITEFITANLPVSLSTLPPPCESPAKEDTTCNTVNPVDSKDKLLAKIPENYDQSQGQIRIIHIGNLDSNACCGTHLSSTAQIKSIILLNQTPGHGTNIKLNFMAGDRVAKFATSSFDILKNLSSVTSCGQTKELPDVVGNMAKELKKLQSRQTNLLKEVAAYVATDLKNQIVVEGKKLIWFHRADVGLEFLNVVFRELNTQLKEAGKEEEPFTCVLISGEGKEGGAVVIFGEKTNDVATELKSKLTGLKGGGKGKFQGKVTAFGKGELEAVKKYLEQGI